MLEFQIIKEFYGDKTAKRSGVPLINHIEEGLVILTYLNASEIAKKAYCLHPIFQSDEALLENYEIKLGKIENKVLICTLEYRTVANEYLSKRIINSLDEIRLSPLEDVNNMLIADKIQNKKDFDVYHKGKHERSDELTIYFNNWLERLGVTEKIYKEVLNLIK